MTLQGKALVVFHTGVGVVLEWAGDEQVAEFLNAEIDRGRPFDLESSGIFAEPAQKGSSIEAGLYVGELRVSNGKTWAYGGVELPTVECHLTEMHPITPDEFRRWCEGHWPWTETFSMEGEGDDSASENHPGTGDGS